MNKNNEPLFSVVIPAYNRAKIISRTIDSVLAQTFTNYEIIIIDDGSKDNLKDVCDNYNKSNIHYYYQDNAGACAARNTGIKKSNGFYIAFLDSDDTWESEYLNEVAQKFQNDQELGCVWVRSIQKVLPDGNTHFMEGKPLEGFVYPEVLKQGYLTSTSFITVKRSLLESLDGFDNNLPASQDDDICFRIAKTAKIGCIDKVLGTLFIDRNTVRISTSDSRRAYGWYLLWCKFSEDLLLYCGKKEFKRKFLDVYSMFNSINDINGKKNVEEILFNVFGLLFKWTFKIKYICYNNIIFFKKHIKCLFHYKK